MAVKKFVVGLFDDEAVLFPAVKKVRTAGYKLHDVYTPFPIHGLDHAMGLRKPVCTQPVSYMVSPVPLQRYPS